MKVSARTKIDMFNARNEISEAVNKVYKIKEYRFYSENMQMLRNDICLLLDELYDEMNEIFMNAEFIEESE